MEVKVEYFQGEERDGFYVQPLMKRTWAVQLDILKEIDLICRRHHIMYLGWFGTLLGAVRHHGFIPWDDDMDLAMPRSDYERFRYLAERELPKGWKVLKVSPTLIRVMNTEVIRLDQEFLDQFHGCPFVMGIDIFCLDHIPKNKTDQEVHLNLFWAVCNLYVHWDMFAEDEKWETRRWGQVKEIEELTGYRFDKQSSMKDQLYVLADKISAMYWDEETDEVANIPWLYRYRHCCFPRRCFDRVIEVPFENVMIPVLEDWDLICRLIYGDDYMTPKRSSAHNSFKEQVDVLRDYFKSQGRDLPEFFDMTFD